MGEMIVEHDIRHGLKANQQITADGLWRRHTLGASVVEVDYLQTRDDVAAVITAEETLSTARDRGLSAPMAVFDVMLLLGGGYL